MVSTLPRRAPLRQPGARLGGGLLQPLAALLVLAHAREHVEGRAGDQLDRVAERIAASVAERPLVDDRLRAVKVGAADHRLDAGDDLPGERQHQFVALVPVGGAPVLGQFTLDGE